MIAEESPVTWQKAHRVLSALANVTDIREVLVVGSVARKGKGNDLDVVLVVSPCTYVAFLMRMQNTSGHYYGYRKEAALAVIKFTPAEWGWLNLALKPLDADVDFHLMPGDWLQNIDAVQSHLPHDDPQFVRNIAGDARRLDTYTGKHGEKIVIDWIGHHRKALA